jgi:hypothetical protein
VVTHSRQRTHEALRSMVSGGIAFNHSTSLFRSRTALCDAGVERKVY